MRCNRSATTVLLFLLVVCSQAIGESPKRWNVILITIDTLRADRLPPYGYGRVRTPHITALAREGTVFEQAIAPTALTLPSHASILTGALPFEHGILDNMGFSLSEEQPTLAEVLSKAGYSTGAFLGSFVLDSRFGLNRGFQTYVDDFVLNGLEMIGSGFIQRPAEEVASSATKWIRGEAEGGRSFFAWIHFYDPHAPYQPPGPFDQQYRDEPYDGEIAYVDQVLGKMLQSWKDLGVLEKTMVVLTSDHGESLGEHGEETHGLFIYESTQRVPLIWVSPKGSGAPRRVREMVRLVDIAPTILEFLNLKAPEEMSGTSLLSLLHGSPQPARWAYAETRYPKFRFGWSPLFAYYRFPFKFILAPQPELYNLEDDPRELANLYDRKKALADELRAELLLVLDRAGKVPPAPPVDPDTVRALGALGYLRLGSGEPGADLSTGADPKEKTDLYRQLTGVYSRIASGELSQALEVLQRLLKGSPGASYIHHPMGMIYSRMGRHSEAVDAYEKALETSGQDSLLRFNLGSAQLRLGRWKEAQNSFEGVLAIDPTHFRARNNLATLALRQGRYLEALEHSRLILKSHPRYEPALFNAGLALMAMGRPREAITRLKGALEVNPRNREAYRYIAEAYSSLGESRKAADYLEKMRSLEAP